MNEIKFNIVKLLFKEDSNKDTIYSHCHNSVLREFPNDNIIIFHSIKEIEDMYDIPSSPIYDFCKEIGVYNFDFVKVACDYIRLNLTKYIDNMIYIDPDIEVFPGFRKSIVEASKTTDTLFSLDGHYLIYSKHRNNLIDSLIQEEYIDQYDEYYLKGDGDHFFLHDNYIDMVVMERFKKRHKLEIFDYNFYFHYCSLWYMNSMDQIIITDKHVSEEQLKNEKNLYIILSNVHDYKPMKRYLYFDFKRQSNTVRTLLKYLKPTKIYDLEDRKLKLYLKFL